MNERDYSLAYNCGQLRLVIDGLRDICWGADDSDDLPTDEWDRKTKEALGLLAPMWHEAMKRCSTEDEGDPMPLPSDARPETSHVEDLTKMRRAAFSGADLVLPKWLLATAVGECLHRAVSRPDQMLGEIMKAIAIMEAERIVEQEQENARR